ncbi:hypothetical protein HYALB_00002073 [Hymenoscyphus albidus]|uniref:Uncharacterized protein n=1 Tax=Hymenoscyphus albidus TaxID=595503 RepID=A0A9N9Q1A9_9HELO|nr:hypothetical protein HYALB_00002073 [Hymenoscyphus albidus]
MPLPPVGTRRYFAIIHLFGNPIDSTWSLLCELELWNNYAVIAESLYSERSLEEQKKKAKYITPILVAMDDLKLMSRTTFKPGNYPQICPCHSSELDSLFFRTAGKLSNYRTHDTRRTCFAIAVYVVGVVANFVKTMGGSPSRSGGKIAPAMLLSWLLLTTLISNLIGQFNSPENVIRIIEDFRNELRQIMGMRVHESQYTLRGKVEGPEPVFELRVTTTELDRKQCSHMEVENQRILWENLVVGKINWAKDPNWIEYLDAPAHGIPIYQPNKQLGNNIRLFTIATIPVLLSFISAFTVLWSPPTYLTCRHFIVVAAFLAWLISPFLTRAFFLSRRLRRNDELGWHFVFLKDFSIAGPIIALLIASTSGLFSSCWCLSGVFILRSKAEIQLNPAGDFNKANGKIYPGIVAANFLLQLVVLGWIVMGVGRKQILSTRVSESETREALIAEISVRKMGR